MDRELPDHSLICCPGRGVAQGPLACICLGQGHGSGLGAVWMQVQGPGGWEPPRSRGFPICEHPGCPRTPAVSVQATDRLTGGLKEPLKGTGSSFLPDFSAPAVQWLEPGSSMSLLGTELPRTSGGAGSRSGWLLVPASPWRMGWRVLGLHDVCLLIKMAGRRSGITSASREAGSAGPWSPHPQGCSPPVRPQTQPLAYSVDGCRRAPVGGAWTR